MKIHYASTIHIKSLKNINNEFMITFCSLKYKDYVYLNV